MWQSSEDRLRRKFRRLARASEMMAREVNVQRDANERLLAVIRALAIYASVVTLAGVACLGIGKP